MEPTASVFVNRYHPMVSDTAPSGVTDPSPGLKEAPPAHTPSAGVYQGKVTIQYGPHIPFQQAPPYPALPPYLNLQAMESSQGWVGYPWQAQMQRHDKGMSNFAPPHGIHCR